MIKTLRTIGFAAALALVAGQAQAVSSLSFVWDTSPTLDGSGPWSPTITVLSSDPASGPLRGAILAVGDTAGMSGIFVSFAFDTDGQDELDILPINVFEPCSPDPCSGGTVAGLVRPGGAEQTTGLPGSGNSFAPGLPGYTRNQFESTPGNGGLLGSYDVSSGQGSGLTAGGTATSITRTLGSIWFSYNNANILTDGTDVDIVILTDGFDAVLASSGANISNTVLLAGGSVNTDRVVVPEPTAALLVVSGLAGLAFAGRRNKR